MPNSNLECLTISAINIIRAHYLLGKEASPLITNILLHKLNFICPKTFNNQIRQARISIDFIVEKSKNRSLPKSIRDTIEEYVACVEAWGEGWDVDQVLPKKIYNESIDGKTITNRDILFWLQYDHFGCHFTAYRNVDRSISFWYAEECHPNKDKIDLCSKSKIVTFNIDGYNNKESFCFFMYPYLLPGPSLSWTRDWFLGAIHLYVQDLSCENFCYSNFITWIAIRLMNHFSVEELISYFTPFINGYALFTLKRACGSTEADMIEFCSNISQKRRLSSEPGSLLIQASLVSELQSILYTKYQHISKYCKHAIEKRYRRIETDINRAISFQKNLTLSSMEAINSLEIGGNYATLNPYTKARFIGVLNNSNSELKIAGGKNTVFGTWNWENNNIDIY